MIKTILLALNLILLVFCTGKINIESTQPHNKGCYTQGLFFLNDTHLFQTCGLYKSSFFHVMEYQGVPFELREVYTSKNPWRDDVFFEGAILFKNSIYILTWQNKTVYKLDPQTFQLKGQLPWRFDGWGLTTNGTHMFSTDGSSRIFIVDENFTLLDTKNIISKSGLMLQTHLNQLQFVDGFIYANIYGDTTIVKVNLDTQRVEEEYDGTNLEQAEKGLKDGEVLNGIAYDRTIGKFILTGKRWSKIYQVTFVKYEQMLSYFLVMLALLLILAS